MSNNQHVQQQEIPLNWTRESVEEVRQVEVQNSAPEFTLRSPNQGGSPRDERIQRSYSYNQVGFGR